MRHIRLVENPSLVVIESVIVSLLMSNCNPSLTWLSWPDTTSPHIVSTSSFKHTYTVVWQTTLPERLSRQQLHTVHRRTVTISLIIGVGRRRPKGAVHVVTSQLTALSTASLATDTSTGRLRSLCSYSNLLPETGRRRPPFRHVHLYGHPVFQNVPSWLARCCEWQLAGMRFIFWVSSRHLLVFALEREGIRV